MADVEELERQLAEIKKAQSGSDRMVQQLTAERDDPRAKLEEATTATDSKLAQREKEIERRQRIVELSIEKNLDPKVVTSMLAANDEAEAVDAVADALDKKKLEAADEFAKKNGRRVQVSNVEGGYSYEELLRMPNHELSRLSDATFERATGEARQKQTETRRAKIMRELSGGA